MNRFWTLLSALFLAAATMQIGLAQTPPPVPALEQILQSADDQRLRYQQEFKNLLSQETKFFETFEKNGDLKKTRTVKSTFIVYQLTKAENGIAEFRNVYEVDGKPLNDAEKRALDFFQKVEKAETLDKELKKIKDESLRHDLDFQVYGFTIFQAPFLDKRARPYFDFRLETTERRGESDVYVVSFHQNRPCPCIAVNKKKGQENIERLFVYDLDLKDDRDYKEQIDGRLWIDAKTFQIVREERTLSVQPEGFDSRVPLDENVFEFQKGDFDIMTPKRIVHTQYELKEKEKRSIMEGRITFDYDKFTRPDVEVKSSDVKNTN